MLKTSKTGDVVFEVKQVQGRHFVITGANSGTGKEAARRIAGAGGHVTMAVRSPEKGEAARREIVNEYPDAKIDVRELELASLESVRRFVDGLQADGVGVDVLINNAGVLFSPTRQTTVDGFELQFGSNFLGPFALTVRLLPTLSKSSAPR